MTKKDVFNALPLSYPSIFSEFEFCRRQNSNSKQEFGFVDRYYLRTSSICLVAITLNASAYTGKSVHKGIQQFARLHLLSQLTHNYLSSTCNGNQVRRSTRLNYVALHLYYTYYKNAIAIANLFSFLYQFTKFLSHFCELKTKPNKGFKTQNG